MQKDAQKGVVNDSARRLRQERGWNWWLIPKPFDLVSSSLYLCVMAGFFYNLLYGRGYPIAWWQVPLMVCTTLALLSVDRLEYWRYGEETPARAAVYFLLARVILIEAVTWLDHLDLSPFLYLIVPFLACLYFGYAAGYLLVGFFWVLYIVRHYLNSSEWLSNSTEIHYLALFTIGLIFSISLARTVVKERTSRARAEQLLVELEDSHRQLKVYSEQVAELATTKERNRLARDIHDSLGHYLTVSNSHFSIDLNIEGSEEGFSKQVLLTIYRAAQEGLTNIQKHARASAVHINLTFSEAGASLTLSDIGCGFEPVLLQHLQPGRSGSYGLQGVQERL